MLSRSTAPRRLWAALVVAAAAATVPATLPLDVSSAAPTPTPVVHVRSGKEANPPGVGAGWSKALAGHGQVLVADGLDNRTDGHVSMTLWSWSRSRGWHRDGSYTAWGGARGWGKTRQGDQRSPVGVFSLHDAGGYFADPGTRMPYDHDPVRYSRIQNGHRIFSYVIAIGYNHVSGTSPLSARTPGPASKGGQIWIHEGHGSASLGCLGTSRAGVVAMLTWADPAARPVILMGPHSAVTRTR